VSVAIEVRGVEKTFARQRPVRELIRAPFRRAERVRALRGVDLEVREGEILGLLGPNGAGKTTLLKILSCLVLPDSGTATVGGHDVADERGVKSRIGLVNSDERSFYWRLNARENLDFFAVLYGVPRERRRARIDELLARVDLLDAADRPFSGYSSGMKQRMAIARALLHDPPILLMDEPTRSLDPSSQLSLRRFVAEELSGRDRKTILLATHNLREAETLCSRIAIMAAGRVREVGTVDQIRALGLREERYRLRVDRWPERADARVRVIERGTVEDGVRVTVGLAEGVDLGVVLGDLLAAGVRLFACERLEIDLEDAFARVVDEPDGDRGAAS